MSTIATSLDTEQLAADAQRLADLYGGAVALLTGECKPTAVTAARATLLESRALLGSIVDSLESLAARRAEAERTERQQREAQNKVHAATVAGSVR